MLFLTVKDKMLIPPPREEEFFFVLGGGGGGQTEEGFKSETSLPQFQCLNSLAAPATCEDSSELKEKKTRNSYCCVCLHTCAHICT